MPRFGSALAAIALLFALAGPATAQEAPPVSKRVVLVDGSVIVGTVVDASADPVVVVGSNGVEQRVPQSQIVEITDLLEGRFTRYDPARTRLFFSPTARSLDAGQKRFSAYYFFPSIAFGVTDRVDVSVGSTIPFISSEGSAIAINGNLKATLVQADGFAAAVGGGATIPLASGAESTGVAGTIYGLATIGSEATAVTLGAYGFYVFDFEGDFEDNLVNGTALLVGLEKQISDRFKLVSENYAFLAFGDEVTFDPQTGETTTSGTTEVAFGTLSGVRFFGDKLAADIAVALGAYEGEFSTVPIPYLGLSYTF